MKFGFIAKHRAIWPIKWLCEALGVSRSGFHAWLTRSPSRRAREDETLSSKVRASFLDSDRTYGARRVWHDLLAEGASCGLHRVERLMRVQALRARPRRRGLPADNGERKADTIAPNLLDRQFEAEAPNKKWVADFTYIWTAEGWLYVAAVIDARRENDPPDRFLVRLDLPTSRRLVDEGGDDGATRHRCPRHGDLASRKAGCAAAPFRSWQPIRQ